MRRIGFQFQVKKNRINEYKEAHRNVWPDVLQALTRHGWHRYSLFMNKDGLVFGYFESEADFDTSLHGFLSEEAAQLWGAAMRDFVEIPDGVKPSQVMVELEEVFHLE